MYKQATLLLLAFLLATATFAQIPRERANQDGPVDEVFWSPDLIVTSSVANIPKGEMDFTIKHVFGVATNGVEDLFGLDAAANIRFGLDFGITDRFSVGFGRSRFDKLYDFKGKLNLLRQTKDGRIPFELAVQGNAGILTLENGFDMADRMSYSAQLMLARQFSERLSIQISPIFTHFNTVFIERASDNSILEEENDHLAVSFAGRLLLSERVALMAEYIPVFGERSDGTMDILAIGFNIETGGHVFQLFATSSQGMTTQHAIARNVDDFLSGDFRLGFTVHRVFGL